MGNSPCGSKGANILANCGSRFRVVGNFAEVQPGYQVIASEETGHGLILSNDCDQEARPGKFDTVKEDPGSSGPKEFGDMRHAATIHGDPWSLVDLA
jgi:hypothetical protein